MSIFLLGVVGVVLLSLRRHIDVVDLDVLLDVDVGRYGRSI